MKIQQYGDKNVTNLTHLAYNTEWLISNTCAINKTINTGVDLEWWVTSYIVEIRRESIYYFYTLIMPCGVLSSCSLLLFWLPPDSEEKITLGVTILLAFFVNSLVVSNYTPESASTLPVIGVYYTFNIFVVALSLTGSVFVLKLHFRGHIRDKVPGWVKNLFHIETDQLIKLSKIHNNIYNNPNVVARFLNQNASLIYKLNEDKLPRTKSSFSTTRQILKLLKEEFEKFQDHRRKEEEKMKLILEWKELARKLDRCFLCVLLVTITITPLVLFGKFFIQDLDSNSNSLLSKNDCQCILDNY